MRRTYRSKKETGGVIDPREVGASFDAFYIQNIKQSKREMSVGFGTSTFASNKVRKRKYVKRLKEQSPMANDPKTEGSKFECLTPDKSIHLKRELDPFDLLLDNLSMSYKESLQAGNNGLTPVPTRGKRKPTYTKTRKAYTKKINYSRGTDSDDENSNDTGKSGIIHDQSDILSHKLEIEKDERVPFNNADQSIDNIDLSLLKSIASPLLSTREDKLSMCVKSPLCSTPFHKKYRGKSIYKFSPICVEFDGNRHCNTITEKIDEINMVEHKINRSHNQHSIVTEELYKSQVNSKNDESDFKGVSDQKSVDYDEVNSPILSSRYNTYKSKNLPMPIHQWSKYKEISSLQTSEEELFLGFPKRISDSENINLKNVMNKLVEINENTVEDVQVELKFSKTSKSFMENSNDKYCCQEDMNNVSKPGTSIDENTSFVEKSFEKLKRQQCVSISPKIDFEKQKHDWYAGNTGIQNNDKDVNFQNDEKELSISNEMTIERSQISYSEENGIDVDKLNTNSLNEENTCKESYFVKSELSLNEEDPSEASQIHSNENSLDLIHIDNVSETSQIYSEENNTFENEKHSTLSCSEGNQGNESSDDRDNSFNDSLDSGSVYESCNSENEMSHIEINNKKLLVVTERLHDSVFNRYYKKYTDLDSIYSSESDEGNEKSYSHDISKNKNSSIKENNMSFSESAESSSDAFSDSIVPDRNNKSYFSEFGSNRNNTIKNNNSFSDSFKSSDDDFGNDMKENTMMNINTDHENDENNKSVEDVFVSFVTTRRRNEIAKHSFKLSFDNTCMSTSSADLNETVLSNNKRSICSLNESIDLTLIGDAKLNNDIVAGPICDDELYRKENSVTVSDIQLELSLSPRVKRVSTSVRKSVTTRKSAKLSTENCDKISINKKIEKREAVKPRKSTKKLSTNINRESISKETDIRSSFVTRRSIKHDTYIISVSTSEEDDDNISRISVVPYSTNIDRDNKPMVTAQKVSFQECDAMICSKAYNMSTSEIKPGIVLEPGKRWERSLSIYRRVTEMGDLNQSILDETLNTKGRKYRQSVINTMEMQDMSVSLNNESVKSHRSTLFAKPSRSTIKIVRESNTSRYSLCSTSSISEDLGFLTEDCDDTLVELSKLSISAHEVTVLDKFNETSSRITTARDYVLRRCNQTDVVLFDECYPDTALKNCRKIGEGVYGEVFLWRAGDGRARVLKIVPIAGDTKVNGENQKDYHEIISEIVIAMELSALRAPITEIEKHLDEGKGVETLDLHSVENATDVFNEVLAVRCVYGSYPSRLLDLWELYDECTGSDNDNPAILPAEQQFMVLELANAGQDLESYQFHNAEQAYALFQQVAFGLAVAEEAFQFEHRDLHWGNVLIAPTEQKYATFVLRGRTHRVPRRGVAATIIDYSLSRLSLRLPSADSAALYNDLAADDGLFDAVGDYQFEVYRLMRDKLGNDWKNFEPYTNILWLHYTVDKMITALRYTRTNTKIHKHYIAKLKDIKNRILEYGSAVQYVLTDNEL